MRRALTALLLVCGCTNNPNQGPQDAATDPSKADLATPDLATPPDLAPLPKNVFGTFIDKIYLPTANGAGTVMNRPRDLSAVPIKLYVINSQTGELDAPINGTGLADGSFSFPDLPQGTRYTMQVGTRWIAGSTLRYHAMTEDYFGRQDGVGLATQLPYLTVNLTGIYPAAITDNYTLFSPTLDSAYDDFANAALGTPPLEGTTTLSQKFNLGVLRPRVLRYVNDPVFLTQMAVTDPAAAINYAAAVRVGTSVGLTVTDAANAGTFSPALTSVAQNKSIPSLNWLRASFYNARTALHPAATALRVSFYVLPTPGGYIRREWPYTPAVLASPPAGLLDPPDVDNKTTGNLTYGSPYTSAWTEIGLAEMAINVPDFSGNGDAAVKGLGSIVYLADIATFKARPIAPLVTPVTNLQINGLTGIKPAQQQQTGVGANPTLTWDAPTTGTPDRYRISLYLRNKPAPETLLATFETTERQLKMPPGLMLAGQNKSYHFIVRAMQRVDVLATGTPQGWADALTAPIQP